MAEIAAVKIEPSAAMPVAMPICRKVRVDARGHPGLLRRDHADGGGRERRVYQAAADPGDDETGDQVRPARRPVSPAITIRPMPTSSRPGPISQRVGTFSLSPPAITDVTSCAALSTAIRSPAPSAE